MKKINRPKKIYKIFFFFIILTFFPLLNTKVMAWCVGGRGNTCPQNSQPTTVNPQKSDMEVNQPGKDNPGLIYNIVKNKTKKFNSEKLAKAHIRGGKKISLVTGLTFPVYAYPNHPADRNIASFSTPTLWGDIPINEKFTFRAEYIAQSFKAIENIEDEKNVVDNYQHKHIVLMGAYSMYFNPFNSEDIMIAKIGFGFALSKVEQAGKEEASYSGVSMVYHLSISKKYILANQNVIIGFMGSILDGKDGGFNLGLANFGLNMGLVF